MSLAKLLFVCIQLTLRLTLYSCFPLIACAAEYASNDHTLLIGSARPDRGNFRSVNPAVDPANTSAEASIIRGPYLQNSTNSSIVIMWETDIPSQGIVLYGETAAYGSQIEDPSLTNIHEVTIEDLNPASLYHYAVISGSDQSTDATFVTAFLDSLPITFIAYGDTRGTDPVHGSIVNSIIPHAPQFVLHTGDYVNQGRDYSQWSPQFFDEAQALMKNTVMFATVGNHEYSGASAEPVWYFNFFSPPENSTDEGWYSFDYGDCHIVSLNTEDDFESGSLQYNWFENDLQSTSKKWKIVVMHRPPYTSGSHATDLKVQQIKDELVPLFEQYKVNIVISGHDHFYERSLKNGIFYIVSGGGGAPLYNPNTNPNPYQICAAKKHHYCLLEIDGPYLMLQAIDQTSVIFDTFTLAKAEVLDVTVENQANIKIKWASAPGFIYDMHYKDHLSDAWIPLNLDITATQTFTTWTDDGSATGGTPPLSTTSRFYRIQLSP